jgi:hypothetical protein
MHAAGANVGGKIGSVLAALMLSVLRGMGLIRAFAGSRANDRFRPKADIRVPSV